MDSEAFVCAEVRSVAASDLAKVYTLRKLEHKHIDSDEVFHKVGRISAPFCASIIIEVASLPAG